MITAKVRVDTTESVELDLKRYRNHYDTCDLALSDRGKDRWTPCTINAWLDLNKLDSERLPIHTLHLPYRRLKLVPCKLSTDSEGNFSLTYDVATVEWRELTPYQQLQMQRDKLMAKYQQLRPQQGERAIGTAHFDVWLAAYTLEAMLNARPQDTLRAAGKQAAREAIAAHNAHKPKDAILGSNWCRAETHMDQRVDMLCDALERDQARVKF